jgi:hypothetical protein
MKNGREKEWFAGGKNLPKFGPCAERFFKRKSDTICDLFLHIAGCLDALQH